MLHNCNVITTWKHENYAHNFCEAYRHLHIYLIKKKTHFMASKLNCISP